MAGSNGSSNGNGNGNGNGHAATAVAGGQTTYPKGFDADGKIPAIEEALAAAFFEVLADTGNIRLACRTVGIHHSTYYRWKKEGERQGFGKYFKFAQAADRGMAEWERRRVAEVRRAALPFTETDEWEDTWTGKDGVTKTRKVRKKKRRRGAWGAAAWLLERRFPETYGRRDHVELEGKLTLVDVLTDLRDDLERRGRGLAPLGDRGRPAAQE